MTFDEWWDTTKATATPDTYAGWEASCRQAWYAARKHEPESVPELRALLQTLGLWIAEALPTLDTVEPECSTEAELLTDLIRRGEMLVLASLSRARSACPSGKCTDPARDCYGSGCLSDEPHGAEAHEARRRAMEAIRKV